MRSGWAPILALVLVGCGGRPEITACEDFTKGGLRSPATYRRVAASTLDERVTPEEFLRRRGDRANDPMRAMTLDALRAESVGIRNVRIEYDAQNAYGTPIRGQGICMFRLRDGQLVDDAEALRAKTLFADTDRDFRHLVDGGGVPNLRPGEVPERPCCL